MRTLALLVGLSLAPAAFASDSRAGGGASSEQREEIKEALTATAQAEQEMMEGIIDALDAMEPLPVSDAAKTQYEEAKRLENEATDLWKAKEYRQAYMKFREAATKLQPALSEVLALPDPPQEVQDAGAELVQVNAKRIELLARAVEAKGSPEAKAAYAEAKTLYQEAKGAWSAGQRREACEKSWASLKKADLAVREMWQANAPTARGGASSGRGR